MKAYKDVTIIEGKLSSLFSLYIEPLRIGRGFERFSDEAIIYSLLEFSRFNRSFNDDERILYLHRKCGEYSGVVSYNTKIDYDDHGNFYLIDDTDSLPF